MLASLNRHLLSTLKLATLPIVVSAQAVFSFNSKAINSERR